ncbi:MAG: 16S rRNA (adenine(1518)-N(6)/adenine(1519)-N(6))-dimethyltransferase RsmA [Metamycoplasmataceae bacterium]
MDKKYAMKRFGQNFLQDEQVLKRIVSSINIENKKIIEIGPGKGALSKLILLEADKLVAFEIDYNLSNFLKLEIENEKFFLINKDFLEVDLSSYTGYSIIANIPYNITTPILFKIFENHSNFDDVLLMVQKEVAERICAKPGTSNYGKLSVTTANFATVKKLFDIGPKAFYPIPKVTSSIIHLKMNKNEWDIYDEKFLNFIKNCFGMRRKTLINNLKNHKNYNENLVKKFLIDNNLNIDIRPQILNLNQYKELFKLLK